MSLGCGNATKLSKVEEKNQFSLDFEIWYLDRTWSETQHFKSMCEAIFEKHIILKNDLYFFNLAFCFLMQNLKNGQVVFHLCYNVIHYINTIYMRPTCVSFQITPVTL